jgi:hypothetical protein
VGATGVVFWIISCFSLGLGGGRSERVGLLERSVDLTSEGAAAGTHEVRMDRLDFGRLKATVGELRLIRSKRANEAVCDQIRGAVLGRNRGRAYSVFRQMCLKVRGAPVVLAPAVDA